MTISELRAKRLRHEIPGVVLSVHEQQGVAIRTLLLESRASID